MIVPSTIWSMWGLLEPTISISSKCFIPDTWFRIETAKVSLSHYILLSFKVFIPGTKAHFLLLSLWSSALQSLWGQGDYKQDIEEMMAEQAAIAVTRLKSPLEVLRDPNVRWQLITTFIICSCMLLSGMSAVRTALILEIGTLRCWTFLSSTSPNPTMFSFYSSSLPDQHLLLWHLPGGRYPCWAHTLRHPGSRSIWDSPLHLLREWLHLLTVVCPSC